MSSTAVRWATAAERRSVAPTTMSSGVSLYLILLHFNIWYCHSTHLWFFKRSALSLVLDRNCSVFTWREGIRPSLSSHNYKEVALGSLNENMGLKLLWGNCLLFFQSVAPQQDGDMFTSCLPLSWHWVEIFFQESLMSLKLSANEICFHLIVVFLTF